MSDSQKQRMASWVQTVLLIVGPCVVAWGVWSLDTKIESSKNEMLKGIAEHYVTNERFQSEIDDRKLTTEAVEQTQTDVATMKQKLADLGVQK